MDSFGELKILRASRFHGQFGFKAIDYDQLDNNIITAPIGNVPPPGIGMADRTAL